MKKILLATTLLAASAGFAAAEGIAVSGKGRMGVIYNGTDAEFTSRIRIIFTGSGETDGGLAFGAEVRNDQSGVGNTANGDSTVYISGAFGKLTFGDVDSAANALVGNVSGVGLTGLDDNNELGYVGQTDTSALYEYSTGALSFALSAGQTTSAGEAKSVAVKYTTDQFAVALGYEDSTVDTQLSLGASATFGAVAVKAVIVDADSAENGDLGYALSVDYTAGAAVITAFYADDATDDDSTVAGYQGTEKAFGLGVAYDLGGGASVVGGVVDNGSDTIADMGLSFKF